MTPDSSYITQLLQRIQEEDDEGAFNEFYRRYVFRLFQFAYAYVKSRQVAEELVNDVFLKLWQSRNGLDKIRNVSVYLYVAVKHTALNYLRQASSRESFDLDKLAVHHFHFFMDPENILMTRELQRKIAEAVNTLPPKCKIVFKLIKEDGMSYKETADILSVSIKTVDTQLTIALRKIEQVLYPVLSKEYPHLLKNKTR